MGDVISVIVPVYKVERYLNQCVESILFQSYADIEVILVDDGSPDRCPMICDKWAKKDSRIKVIHKENGGLSDARNAGMNIATGNYIGFVDSDDWIAPNMYELLLQELKRTQSDISACGVQMVWNDGRTKKLTCGGKIVLDNLQAMKALIEESWLKQPVWYKLYKRSVVEGILFEKGKCHEDVFWSYKPLARAKRVCVVDTVCYFYRQRDDSIMGASFSRKRLDALEAMIERIEFMREKYPNLVSEARVRAFFYGMYLAQWALREEKCDVLQDIQKMTDIVLSDKASVDVLKDKIWVIMSKINFLWTCKLRNSLKIGM